MNVYIYLLLNPNKFFENFEFVSVDTIVENHLDLVRYVGKTYNYKNRYLQHCQVKQSQEYYHKTKWVKSLKKENKKPMMIIIDVCGSDNWKQIEKDYIDYFRNLISKRLTNSTKVYEYFDRVPVNVYTTFGEKLGAYPNYCAVEDYYNMSPNSVCLQINKGLKAFNYRDLFFVKASEDTKEYREAYFESRKKYDHVCYHIDLNTLEVSRFDKFSHIGRLFNTGAKGVAYQAKMCDDKGFFWSRGELFVRQGYHRQLITRQYISQVLEYHNPRNYAGQRPILKLDRKTKKIIKRFSSILPACKDLPNSTFLGKMNHKKNPVYVTDKYIYIPEDKYHLLDSFDLRQRKQSDVGLSKIDKILVCKELKEEKESVTHFSRILGVTVSAMHGAAYRAAKKGKNEFTYKGYKIKIHKTL